jgi:hypothetical protein
MLLQKRRVCRVDQDEKMMANGESAKFWKEAIMTSLMILSSYSHEQPDGCHDYRNIGTRSENQTGYFTNTSQSLVVTVVAVVVVVRVVAAIAVQW